MRESHTRSLMKAISYRICGTFTTMFISFLVVHEIDYAFYIGVFDFVSKIIVFYIHERIWNQLPMGLPVIMTEDHHS